MKVKDLKVFIVGTPPPHFGGAYFIFVKVTTDNGISGYGEVYCDTFGPKALTAMIEDEERQAVAEAMSALPERQRIALILFHMEGLSMSRAAQAMNVSEKAFESLLIRGRSALKQRVASGVPISRRYA